MQFPFPGRRGIALAALLFHAPIALAAPALPSGGPAGNSAALRSLLVRVAPSAPVAPPGLIPMDKAQAERRVKLETDISGDISPRFAGARYSAVVRAFEEFEKGGGKADPYSRSIHCLALQHIGRWGDAAACLDRTGSDLAARASGQVSESCGLFGVCVGMALVSSTYHMGRARQALAVGEAAAGADYARTAVAAAEFTGAFNRGGLPWALSQQAVALALAGRPGEARAVADRTLKELGDTNALSRSGVADDTYFNLASAQLALGDGQAAWDMARRIGTEKALPQVIAATGAIGTAALAALGGPGLLAALTTADLARQGAEYDALWTHAAQARRMFISARAALAAGALAEAKPLHDALLADPIVQAMAEVYPAVLEGRGRIARAEGEVETALRHYAAAVEIIETARASFAEEAGRMGFVQDKQGLYLELVDTLVAAGRAAEAFNYAERAKARALVDLLGTRALAPTAGGEAARLAGELDQARRLAGQFNPAVSGAALEKTRSLVIRQREQLAQAAPQTAALVGMAVPGAQALLAALPAGETLLEYFGAGGHWYAFVARREGVTAQRIDLPDIAEQVRAWRQAIEAPASASHRALGAALHARLIAPLAEHLGSGPLTIVPHGPLHYLPWAALPDGPAGYLLDRHAIRVLPSASVLPLLRPSRGGGALLALGNPDLGDPALDLPGAQAEVEAIAARRPNALVKLRGAASEALVKREGARHGVLHLASHGVFDGGHPLESSLFLAPGEGEDGRLTVGELYGLRLDADLVTLSACETGLGSLAGGDDLVGLTRGFLYAGASAVIASLWQVSDETTARLMVAFYAAPPGDRRETLRQAQQAVRAAGHDHPWYWAAFQLTGRAD